MVMVVVMVVMVVAVAMLMVRKSAMLHPLCTTTIGLLQSMLPVRNTLWAYSGYSSCYCPLCSSSNVRIEQWQWQ
jgi:hypothetical protein